MTKNLTYLYLDHSNKIAVITTNEKDFEDFIIYNSLQECINGIPEDYFRMSLFEYNLFIKGGK